MRQRVSNVTDEAKVKVERTEDPIESPTQRAHRVEKGDAPTRLIKLSGIQRRNQLPLKNPLMVT